MKRFIITFICLITIVMNVDAQWYRAGGRAGNRMASYAHSVKVNAIQNNARLKKNSHYSSHNAKNSDMSWLRHFVPLGFGIGGGAINPTGNLSHSSFDLDLICMNVLMTIKLGSYKDRSCGYDVASSDANSFQLGVLIPIITFDKSEYITGQKGKIFIAPIIGFINSDDTKFDGHYMHENTYHHNCQYWISDNKVTDTSCTEFGGAVMVKYGCGYILGKVTNKSWGVTMGLCM